MANEDKRIYHRLEMWIIAIPIVLMLLVLFPYFRKFDLFKLSNKQEIFGVFGDYFGGVLNPLLTFLTLIFLLWQWSETKKREDERDKRESEQEMLSMKFQSEISKREDDRDKRETSRDLKSKEKETIDLFFRKINLLDHKIELFAYKEYTGMRALIFFNNEIEGFRKQKLKIRDSSPALVSSLINGISILKSTNSLFREAIEPNFFKVHNNQMTAVDPKFTSMLQYQILTSHYSEEVVLQLNEFIKLLVDIKHSADLGKIGNYIQAMANFLTSEGRKDFPETSELNDIARIFEEADLMKSMKSR